jgi:hypothetical protein
MTDVLDPDVTVSDIAGLPGPAETYALDRQHVFQSWSPRRS